jgi:basic amino acid/polyamine antiporter, APA family
MMPAVNTDGTSLKRVIGVSGVAFTAFNTMVGSGIFGMPALVAAVLGPAAILAYLVCVVLIALVGLCFAEVGSRVSSSGGLYAYARVSFGPVVGGIAGALLLCANSVAPNAAIALFMTETLSVVWPVLNETVPRTVFLAAVYCVLATVNIRGTRSGVRLAVAMAFIKLTPLILLIVAGAFAIHGPNLQWPATPSIATIGQGAALLFFAFMGIEGGLGTSGEVVNPARTMPRAILLALTLVAMLYIGLQLVAQGVLGPDLAISKAPLVATATEVFGSWGTRLFVVATILSAAGYLVADMLCSPRGVYALAEAGQLPRKLAAVHPRFGTPSIAIALYAFAAFMAAASGSFRSLALVAASGTLMLYLICCLGLLRLRALNVEMAGPAFRAPGGALVPLAASAIIVWLLATLTWRELFAAICIVVVSGVAYGIRQRLLGKAPLVVGPVA